MAEHRWVSTRIAVGLVRSLEALGTPTEALDEALGVPRALAADPDARMPLSVVYSLWELGARHRNSPALPIEVARVRRSPPHADVFTFLCQTSPTLGAAIDAACRYLAMRTTSFRLELADEPSDPDTCALVQHRPPAARLGRQLAVEGTLAEILGALRKMVDPALAPVRVDFEHRAPTSVRDHTDYLRCQLRFEALRNAIILRREDLSRPMPMGDPAMAAYFDGKCREALATFSPEGDLVEQVRDHLLRALPSVPPIAQVARTLALSERTLRRRLAERGTSFDALVSSVRVALAQQHLAQSDLAVSDIGYLTGFADPSAFARFFRRQTGMTPAERRQLARTQRRDDAR